jgi:hypothetical protein
MPSERIQQVRAQLGPGSTHPAAVSRQLAVALSDFFLLGEPSPEALKEAFRRDRGTTITRLLHTAKSWRTAHLGEQLSSLESAGLIPSDLPLSTFAEETYVERIAHLALEHALINPAAPPLLISPVPDVEETRDLSGNPVVAVLFDHPLAVTHELYPLWTDAYVFSCSAPAGTAPLQLIGVHNSWLDAEGRARRVILFQPDLDLFIETPLQHPLPLSSALLLCQSPESHCSLSALLETGSVPHINPYAPAAIADDKWSCFERWQKAEVPTPPTCLLGRELTADSVHQIIRSFANRCGEEGEHGWVIQPRHGTEGAQVTWVERNADAMDVIVATWRKIAADDDAILRPRIGLVGLPSRDGSHPFDLRLHVSFDGNDYSVESGYLQVAPAGDKPVSSMSRGGQIRSISQLDAEPLVHLSDALSIPWSAADLARSTAVAIQAVRAVGPLDLAGVDIKIDSRNGILQPTVLDLNPRPAGLLHANLLVDGEPGIGPGLWRRLVAMSLEA